MEERDGKGEERRVDARREEEKIEKAGIEKGRGRGLGNYEKKR